MFRAEEIEKLDGSYFNIILAEEYDAMIQSRNTGHIWYIHNPEYPGEGECIIFHKHRASPSLIISMGGPGVWGRRYGVLWGMMCSR